MTPPSDRPVGGAARQRGIAGRDALWAHPDLIPSADDLDNPAAFVSREELGDPIAELEKAIRAESADDASDASASDASASDAERGDAGPDDPADGSTRA